MLLRDVQLSLRMQTLLFQQVALVTADQTGPRTEMIAESKAIVPTGFMRKRGTVEIAYDNCPH